MLLEPYILSETPATVCGGGLLEGRDGSIQPIESNLCIMYTCVFEEYVVLCPMCNCVPVSVSYILFVCMHTNLCRMYSLDLQINGNKVLG